MITEVAFDTDYLTSIWDSLDKDKFIVLAEYDEEVRDRIKHYYKQIQILKKDGIEKKKPKG